MASSQKEVLPLHSEDWTELIRSSADEEIRVRNSGDLLLVRASSRFDITAVEIASDSSAAGMGRPLQADQHLSSRVEWERGPLPVTVALRAPRSSVDVQLWAGGRLAGFVNVSSSKPVALELDLRSLVDREAAKQPLRVEMRVLRGEASGIVSARSARSDSPLKSVTAMSGGTAWFNYSINWQHTPDLYYYISGGPVSTCGELNTYRNGSWLYSPSWVCTNGSGSATKGPWSWSSTPSNQTDDPAFIRWPDGTSTNTATHIWDKNCPSVQITSTYGAPPSTYYGTATDVQWGACFDSSWTYVYSYFVDLTASPDLWWNESSSSYSSTIPYTVYGSVSGMPSCGVSWSTNFPDPSDHIAGHTYFWQTCISDGGCVSCTGTNFTP